MVGFHSYRRHGLGRRGQRVGAGDIHLAEPDAPKMPSAAMLAVWLVSAAFYQPYWIAAAAAFTAAGTEYYSPRIGWIRDDNLSVVAASLAVMAVLTMAVG